MKKLIIQFLKFLCISGVGWLIDFGIYSILTYGFNFNVLLANILSSIPAITYVFFVSTRKIFAKSQGKLALKYKYIIYLIYQLILVLSISGLGQLLYNWLLPLFDNEFIINNLKLFIKIAITPITMVLNFIVMKILSEKV